MALANANSTLAAEQQNYENWKEGGASRVWAHALVGGLAGNLQGAAGAALASAAAPVLDELTRDLPSGVKEAVGAGLAVGLGATAGGAAGATTAFNADVNNRQSNAAQRDALARLQKNKGEADQKKLADAMCALLKCAAVADPNSAGYAAKVLRKTEGPTTRMSNSCCSRPGCSRSTGGPMAPLTSRARFCTTPRTGCKGRPVVLAILGML